MTKTYQEIKQSVIDTTAKLIGGYQSMTPFIPCMVNGHLCERVFLYSAAGRRNQPRLRPHHSLLIDSENGRVMEYRNAYASDFADTEKYPLGMVMDYSVPEAQTAVEQGKLLEQLEVLYKQVRVIAFDEDADVGLLRDYDECLRRTVPNALLAFCTDAEPAFFAWLRKD